MIKMTFLGVCNMFLLSKSIQQNWSKCRHTHKTSLQYRQLQIFGILSNDCFQTYTWTTIQFNGAICVIGTLYCFIVLNNQLPFHVNAFLLTFIITVLVICLFFFEVGSRPLLISRGILRQLKNYRRSGWATRFAKSCKPIAMHVEAFYKMDRRFGPAFVRFCAQRTVFLVVQTESLYQGSDQN